MKENQLLELIDRYLNGEMTAEERADFEALRQKDAAVEAKFTEHKEFLSILKQYSDKVYLEERLNAIHDEIDVHTLSSHLTEHPSLVIRLWRNHHSKISVAASIAIFAMLLTLLFTGYLSNKDPRYQQLVNKVNQVESSTRKLEVKTNNIITSGVKTGPTITAKFRGTGFALSSNGYIITNLHVVNGADSVYVQNDQGESFHTKVVYTEPQYDVAILQINDPSFKNLDPVPYTIKKGKSDLGEYVYTFGYPSDNVVFGEGALASAAGFRGDTSEYQVSVPVNPGNSGGPLLDSKGNIIGVISGKQTQASGVAFAVKSTYLLKAIQNIPADSLTKGFTLTNKNTLATLSRQQQVKKLRNYVFMVKVYNQ